MTTTTTATPRVNMINLPTTIHTVRDRFRFAESLGFDNATTLYAVGDDVDILDFCFSSSRATRYDVYWIGRGIVKKVDIHGIYVQTHDDLHRPSGWIRIDCAGGFVRRRRP